MPIKIGANQSTEITLSPEFPFASIQDQLLWDNLSEPLCLIIQYQTDTYLIETDYNILSLDFGE